MTKLLHINAAVRGEESRTLKVSKAVIENFKSQHPESEIEELNLFQVELPLLTVDRLAGKYLLMGGQELDGEVKEAWQMIEHYINQFLSADRYLISAPMWNFSIPYVLKHYIDVIVQPKFLFQYGENGVEGLAKNKKMVVVTSRGGDYGPESPAHSMDHQEPYLRTVFNFVGIEDLTFIHAQPMDAGGEEVRETKIAEAIANANTL